MITTYYCVESEVFSSFMFTQTGVIVILINLDDMGNYTEDDTLIITHHCTQDLSKWKGMILFQ